MWDFERVANGYLRFFSIPLRSGTVDGVPSLLYFLLRGLKPSATICSAVGIKRKVFACLSVRSEATWQPPPQYDLTVDRSSTLAK